MCCRFIAKFEYEYPRIRVVSVVRALNVLLLFDVFVLVVRVVDSIVFVMYESSSVISHKIAVCVVAAVTENILSFALSSLFLVYMKFLMSSVIK